MTQLPILFLPGTLCTSAMFKHQIEQLKQYSDHVCVVQFTTEPTLAKMAEKVILAAQDSPCALVGFSMGGIVALEVAKTRPDLIAKLAMVNSNCHADLPERKVPRQQHIAQAKSGNLKGLMLSTFLPNYLFKSDQQHEAIIIEMAMALGADCFAAQAMALEDRPDSLSTLQQLAIKTLIIGGAQDKVCPASHQKMMHQAVTNSQLALLDCCGHFSPLEQPTQVSKLLTQWYLAD